MSATEMHALEKAALDDPLLADALDGYRGARPSVTAQHLNEIRSRIGNARPVAATPVVPLAAAKTKWWRALAAAAIIGLMALGVWQFMNPSGNGRPGKGEVARNEAPAVPATTAPAATEEPTAQTDSITVPPPQTGTAPLSPAQQEKSVAGNLRKARPVPASSPVTAVPAQTTALPDTNNTDRTDRLYAEVAMTETTGRSSLQQTNARLLPSVPVKTGYLSKGQTVMNNTAPADANNMLLAKPANRYFIGKVLDPNGNPVPGATISASENNVTVSNTDGSFRLPAGDSAGNLSFAAAGYNNKVQQMLAGKATGIRLEESKNELNEVVVVGYGTAKKRASANMASSLKVDTLPYRESPYPQGGWNNFYDQLTVEMGINKATASRDLHLTFTIEDGIPQNFTVIKTPDAITAQKAISIIKKGPKWKMGRKKKKKVDLKMKVD
ncbi:hypothetical protein A8C56_10730 [Niabella ginsenosidivorans]|uniref:TonB C-terminal domain-containing protein n=2 Tax=Niabella ginsenosidivorans TaxID=1176587 RepID=A0A1A9I198_9BACT|nr:hypothetical protein A8C56_10730 [Niabella ginsenosidivorans]